MKGFDILLSPPIAFVLFLIAAALLFRLGRRMAPKSNAVGGKLTSYACGEDMPGQKIQFGYRLFFFVALFFTIMHVAALVIATVPTGKIVLFADGDLVSVSTGADGARLLYVGGKPLREPIAWGGPIVMNTAEQLDAAWRELEAGTFVKSSQKGT